MLTLRIIALAFAAGLSIAGGTGGAFAAPVETSRIFDNLDAEPTCQRACGAVGWTGAWRPIDMGHSLCFCNNPPPGGAAPPPQNASGPGSNCTAPAGAYCGGCSVACPVGQAASCTTGVPLNDNQPGCWTQAKCECH